VEREQSMLDDAAKKGPADRSKISFTEPHEVQYWADKFGVSKEGLGEAVRKVCKTLPRTGCAQPRAVDTQKANYWRAVARSAPAISVTSPACAIYSSRPDLRRWMGFGVLY
jgi:hypothetical protein